jgi:hypothetical protein
MTLSWMQICAIVQTFAIAQNCYVSLDEERQQILLYKSGNVVFQLPKLIVVPATLNQGAWAIHLVRGYHQSRLVFPPTYLEHRFNDTLSEAWQRAIIHGDEL